MVLRWHQRDQKLDEFDLLDCEDCESLQMLEQNAFHAILVFLKLTAVAVIKDGNFSRIVSFNARQCD